MANFSMAQLQPYPAYKPSGIPWLDDVPVHWEVRRLKSWVGINEAVLPEATEPEFEFRYLEIGSVGTGVLISEPVPTKFEIAPSRARRVVRTGDTIVSTVRTYLKATWFAGEVKDDLICSTGFAVLTPRKGVWPRFLKFAAQSNSFNDRVTASSVGTAYPAIPESRLGAFQVPLPPLSEQRAIVRYLDHVDRRIRRYIDAKQKLIDLLEEEKQAVINHAVTRGLDPNVRLKPSGVEWLGDVPEHWEVTSLKWYSNCRSGDGLSSSHVSLESVGPNCIPVIGGNGVLGFAETGNCMGPVLAIGRVGALCGNVHLIEGTAWITDNALMLSTHSDSVSVKYVALILKARNLNDTANKTAQPLITGTGVLNERIPIPSIYEQNAIAEHLDMATADTDTAIARAQRQIELLEEYRTRLIADVVTGKLDVREASVQLLGEDCGVEPIDEEAMMENGMDGDPLNENQQTEEEEIAIERGMTV